jgi:hypothetical protein
VVEEARLESVYTPKAYRGFESRFLRRPNGKVAGREEKYSIMFIRNKRIITRFINKQFKNNKKRELLILN